MFSITIRRVFPGPLKIIFILLGLSTAACAPNLRGQHTPSPTPAAVTLTATPSLTPSPSGTPLPAAPSIPPTLPPVEGRTTTQVNVRSEPSTAGRVLGIIPADRAVQITGRDPGGNWWQIQYPQGAAGRGWVTAQYVSAAAGAEVPVISGTGSNNLAVVQQKINIRSGPGTSFDPIGTLNPQDAVTLTGKDPNGAWLQIEYSPGPGGRGWISAAFIQAQGVEGLPIVTESGVIVRTGTPVEAPLPPTPTRVPAWPDGDSAGNPLTRVAFHPSGTHTLIYNGDVSSPEGDSQDWIGITPHNTTVLAGLACTGDGSLEVDVREQDLPVEWPLECGQGMQPVPVKPNVEYLIHLQAPSSSGALIYINYTLTIQTSP